jgi:hypothetical protein
MSSSRTQRAAEKKIKKYYDEKKSVVEKKAKTDTQRLQEDIQNILRDSGVAKTRATEDYIRNIGNLEANKAADVDDLNYYVSTSAQRTGEDLTTALMKESRRYGLEAERINEGLAESGLTFSERRPEQIAREGSAINTADIQTEAKRSFQDIARYEAAKNRDLELKYGQAEAEAGVSKTRSLEDILNSQREATLSKQRGIEDVAFGKAQDIKDISYSRDTDVATTGQLFEQNRLAKKLYEKQYG